ncbi:MAG: SGNH/GDSL hydrolase family protein [Candidatus Omnitrophica bacterium]|nr:SGNH/GDSL hydrolase family protein [Candidatus Omnitrophota bacterium]MBU1928702.1 SGNH/GDSL hydrolase family protein [Candidatus Omnitrophota bacterium]MBU2035364.1 SGNH/GDSL hydrolase family protein [Candidatus Omnitrophota bacterium]
MSKTELKNYVMGSKEYLLGTQALAQCHLNLGAWHGFQEVIYKNKIDPRAIEFRFLLRGSSYLYFIFHKSDEKFSGVRISRNGLYKSIYFNAYSNGEFIDKTELLTDNLGEGRWNNAKLVFQNEGASFYINNKLIGFFKEDLSGRQSFGFRAGARRTLVDDLLIKQNDSREPIRDSFCNIKFLPRVFHIVLIMIGIINLVIFFILKIGTRRALYYLFAIDIFILLASVFFILFVNYYIVGRYPKDTWKGVLKLAAKVNANIIDQYVINADADIYRIIYMGSSQAAGSGANRKNDTFVNLVERRLNKKNSGKPRVKFINTSVCGSNSSILLKYYKNNWIKLNPKITVVHLSNNDKDPKIFNDNLQEIVNLNKQNGIKTIFVLEANSIEYNSGGLTLHKVMRRVGKENNILTIDLHQYLKQKYDTGILWWDKIHLAQFGHELTADFLSDHIANVINSTLAASDSLITVSVR